MSYIVSGEYIEGEEFEQEFESLEEAQSFAGVVIDDGGSAEITDLYGFYHEIYSSYMC